MGSLDSVRGALSNERPYRDRANRLSKNFSRQESGSRYDFVHDDSHLQNRCVPGPEEPAAAADRGLRRPGQPGSRDRGLRRALDLAALGFRHADRDGGAGQPPYDPADLLKLYLYGYLNQVRSSRRLAREAERNLEVMWLLKGLEPGYRTIGDFRKDNRAALKAANRDFVLVLHELELLGGDLVAIDGAFFHGDASKASIVTRKRLAEQVACMEQDIEAYAAALEANDATRGALVRREDGGSRRRRSLRR